MHTKRDNMLFAAYVQEVADLKEEDILTTITPPPAAISEFLIGNLSLIMCLHTQV